MTEEKKKLDAAPLVQRLIEKSNAGKLDWEPTANRKQFVTSVGGDTSFNIRMVTVTDIDYYGQPETIEVPRLDMLDQDGSLLWQVQGRDVPEGQLKELFEIARRIGNRLDSRVDGAINALDEL